MLTEFRRIKPDEGVVAFGVRTATLRDLSEEQKLVEALSVPLNEGVRKVRREGRREGVERAFWCIMVFVVFGAESKNENMFWKFPPAWSLRRKGFQ